MKFKVYPPSEEDKEQYFKLRELNNKIELVAVDQYGKVLLGGCILGLSADGICLFPEVSHKLGLPLGDGRRVKVRSIRI